ncbi:hypothetical protein OCU04_001656 [Sclerotinia nivalis]|uniref:Heterokaryon incompatibility domain-containing protein n=1 Tax=Sclerotinia nivalis TaxID=352851 RepID=A0A9X0AYK8_9HELO|nr:hypothetical protein OCU04_001656 [Sclerotinia nivalis]
MSEASINCATCEQIIEFFNTATEGDTVSLGFISSLVDTDCPHREWIKQFDRDGASIQDRFESKIDMVKAHAAIELRLNRNGKCWPGCRFKLAPRKNDELLNSGHARILDPAWIDEKIILNWEDLCKEHHEDACEYPEKFQLIESIRSTWLVDILAGCLVPGPGHTRFITLSYTRGEVAFFQTEKNVIDQLQEVGALTAGPVAERLPRTIRSAIDVVRLLGERYLWVDVLCIVQDDAKALQVALNSMARIYSTSYITIVAANGIDASYGIRGFKGLTPQRDFKQDIMPMVPPVNLVIPRNRGEKSQSAYYSRAWTYQEYLCAKRRLIFENGTVYWECSRSRWSEELVPDLPPFEKRSIEPWKYPDLFTLSSFPDLRSMNYLLRDFNQKALTFPEDALSAFSGLQWVLSQTFVGGLLYGIPELFFESGLMWNTIGLGERRHSTRKHMSQLPSWLFLGWQVGATFKGDYEFQAGWWTRDESLKGVRRPVTTWYTMEHPTSSKRRRIESNWYKYRVLAEDITQEPLQGWMRTRFGWNCGHPLLLNTFAYSGDGQEYGYLHSNSPDRWYKYPVPLLDCYSMHLLQPQTQFLSCQTSRVFLHGIPDISAIERKESSSPSELRNYNNYNNVKLQDENGEAVGFLALMRERDRNYFAENIAPGAVVELVAISEGWFGINNESGEEEKEIKDWTPRSMTRQDCYHVLWVEWEDGTAYRRGSGYVLKEVWERKKEEALVDLILG